MEHIARTSTTPVPYRIRLVLFRNGMRFPMMIDRETGLPLFWPMAWTMSQYRHRSAATIEQALRGAMVLHLFCQHRSIDLAGRMRTGVFLRLHEIEALVAVSRMPTAKISALGTVAEMAEEALTAPSRRPTPHRTKHLRRMLSAKKLPSLHNRSVAIRLHYLVSYLTWWGRRAQDRLGDASGIESGAQFAKRSHEEGLRNMTTAILARQPRAGEGGRIALTPEQRQEMLRVTQPASPRNPWQGAFVRLRNQLILLWLAGTGMRRGELLSVRIAHIRFGTGCVEIRRTHDDRRDPRRRQPVAKCGERLAPLDEDMVDLTNQYIAERSRIEAARKHGFLFVAEDGAPLSLSSITALFASLREAHPQLGPVSAHVLRHTWNEDFSAYAEESGMSEGDEESIRRELMGWSLRSKMPTVYGRRRTLAKASQFSKLMQRRILLLKDAGGDADARA